MQNAKFKIQNAKLAIPQSALLTAPFTQRSLMMQNAKFKMQN